MMKDVRLHGNLTYTDAMFREGPFAGNDVPLVSHWTGNVGLSWNIIDKALTFDTIVRYVGERRMDNDQNELPADDPGLHHGGRSAWRTNQSVQLVGGRGQSLRCRLFRLFGRKRECVRQPTMSIRSRAAPSWSRPARPGDIDIECKRSAAFGAIAATAPKAAQRQAARWHTTCAGSWDSSAELRLGSWRVLN